MTFRVGEMVEFIDNDAEEIRLVTIEGIVAPEPGSAYGFGFLIADEGGQSWTVSPDEIYPLLQDTY